MTNDKLEARDVPPSPLILHLSFSLIICHWSFVRHSMPSPVGEGGEQMAGALSHAARERNQTSDPASFVPGRDQRVPEHRELFAPPRSDGPVQEIDSVSIPFVKVHRVRRLNPFGFEPEYDPLGSAGSQCAPEMVRDFAAADSARQLQRQKTEGGRPICFDLAQCPVPIELCAPAAQQKRDIQEMHEPGVGLQGVEGVVHRKLHEVTLFGRDGQLYPANLLDMEAVPEVQIAFDAEPVPARLPRARVQFNEEGAFRVEDALCVPGIFLWAPEEAKTFIAGPR